MKNTQLTNALVIIGVLLIIYFFISPTQSCKRDNSAIDPFKSYTQWLAKDYFSDYYAKSPEERKSYDSEKEYAKKKKEYERDMKNMTAQFCRSQNSW